MFIGFKILRYLNTPVFCLSFLLETFQHFLFLLQKRQPKNFQRLTESSKNGDGRTIAKMQLNQTEVPFRTFVTKKPTPLFDCLSYFLLHFLFCSTRFIFSNFLWQAWADIKTYPHREMFKKSFKFHVWHAIVAWIFSKIFIINWLKL